MYNWFSSVLTSRFHVLTHYSHYYKKYTADLQQDDYGWFLQWTEEKVKDYYLNDLLLHEMGHLVDSVTKRFWSKTTHTKTENYANNFVAVWGNKTRETFER